MLCDAFFRLAKAEDDHQIAIAEKLDLEARLNEEILISKVFLLKMNLCIAHKYSYKPVNSCNFLQRLDK